RGRSSQRTKALHHPYRLPPITPVRPEPRKLRKQQSRTAGADAQHSHLLIEIQDPRQPGGPRPDQRGGVGAAELREGCPGPSFYLRGQAGGYCGCAIKYLVKAGFVIGQSITVDGGATRVKKKS
ncbi:hypothetical protein D0863_03726, partial [Hortaea werneckii]